MGQTRLQLKASIKENLDDAGVTFYTEEDLNNSLQDAYDDIVCVSQCIIKTVDVAWIGGLSYYNFKEDSGLTDYLATVAIFNYATNRWLRDDLNLRDLDRIRRDWENWIGTPQFWCSSDPLHIAIAPKYLPVANTSGAFNPFAFSDAFYIGEQSPLGTFKLLYWAMAPVTVNDSGTYLVATDMQDLFEFYVTADMLESAEEFNKAQEFWEKYYKNLIEYSERVHKNNRSDLLLRV